MEGTTPRPSPAPPPLAQWLQDRGFVPIAPYREAFRELVPPGYRSQWAIEAGLSAQRCETLLICNKQQSIHRDEANMIAKALGLANLMVDEDLPRPSKDPLLRRSGAVRRALRVDASIHPLDALAFVVWPPQEVLDAEEVA